MSLFLDVFATPLVEFGLENSDTRCVKCVASLNINNVVPRYETTVINLCSADVIYKKPTQKAPWRVPVSVAASFDGLP
jgi:hypothetical protein